MADDAETEKLSALLPLVNVFHPLQLSNVIPRNDIYVITKLIKILHWSNKIPNRIFVFFKKTYHATLLIRCHINCGFTFNSN